MRVTTAAILLLGSIAPGLAPGQQARLAERPPDPHGSPRPARDAQDVPTRSSLYLELATPPGSAEVDPETVSISLESEGGEAVTILGSGRRFAGGASGWLRPRQDLSGVRSLAVYVEPGAPMIPATRQTVRVEAGGSPAGTWSFTTEGTPKAHALSFPIDLAAEPVRWRGRFFSGICNVIFCSDARSHGPTYDLMTRAHRDHPRAWDYQRDFWPTGTEFRPGGFLPQRLPNLVVERETRRISAIEPREGAVTLRVEDVFGHRQYGIPDGRPVADDFHPGDEVLIADGVHDARSKVISADGAGGTVTVAPFPTPAGGWKIAYEAPPPTKEDPDAPGLFPPGGCYLRKFAPHGTACYYWGRLDKEWDLAHRRGGRRLMVNFADAAGDLARDGRSWTTAKDLPQWHDVARTITGHLIDRYGAEAAVGFTWSVFNEPDLGPLFWRADWDELQRFYDYTADAVLRAFEDRGIDSERVTIGGLELGAIFGTNLKLREFLAHCSPRATAPGALTSNAAVADRRLDGKRSGRSERLANAHGGKGTPCDFVSIHSYNRSEVMAAKLIRAKEMALEIDPEYYRDLRVNSHEACPDWMPPPDEAAVDAYLGNGYFPTWCLDVVHRQLSRAATDPRFASGETILTVWPPPANFAALNAVTRNFHVDKDGDGRSDGTETLPMPIFHALGLLSDLGDRYWVLPGQAVGGHKVGGFASRDDRGAIRVALFAHQAEDTQSRSDASFEVTLDLAGLGGGGPARVVEYRIDRDTNSPFRLAKELTRPPSPPDAERMTLLNRDLGGKDPAAQARALRTLRGLDPATRQAAVAAVFRLAGPTSDPAVRDLATEILKNAIGPVAYPPAVIGRIREATECRPTATTTLPRAADGRLRITARLAPNGCVFLVIDPAGAR